MAVSVEKKEFSSPDEIIVYDVRRYGTAGRFYHWIHAACMMLFISTGWQIHINEPIFGDMKFVRLLHIGLGIFIILWDLIAQIAIILIDGHIMDIIPTPWDVRDIILIVLCTTGIISDDHYPHYDFYDPDLGVYVRKYHPGQKFLAISDLVAMVFMGSTGIALAEAQEAGSTGIMSFFAELNFFINPFIDMFGLNMRFIHFLLFVFFTLTTFFHMYFALIPQNFSRLKAMITGKEQLK
ncbi:MAG: hypothetical protein ACXAC7_17975 [Candidatus Hodarchaeales archaeon]|jgi:cytochrome b subunit of formate dehydrogenase